MTVPEEVRVLEKSLDRLCSWVEDANYAGYEPFDGCSSWLSPITFGNSYAQRILMQIFLRCPWNIRPLFGIKKLPSAQGMGFFARSYLRLWQMKGSDSFREKACRCLKWLMDNSSKEYSGYCWGNLFHSACRACRIPKYSPTVVWTSHVGEAFMDAYEILEDEIYLEVASSICSFILKDLPREKTDSGTCISYFTFDQLSLHNSNMLAASFLARTACHTGDEVALRVAREAVRYTCLRQGDEGEWKYGQEAKFHWIDNWHTAYNLDSLLTYIDKTQESDWKIYLDRGIDFYVKHFFEETGRPRYYHNRLFTVDIQAAAQSIETLVNFTERHPEALQIARRVAAWTIDNMQDNSGYFHYRVLKRMNVKIPMMHWGQSSMISALSALLKRLR